MSKREWEAEDGAFYCTICRKDYGSTCDTREQALQIHYASAHKDIKNPWNRPTHAD